MANGRVKGEYGPIDYPVDENGYSIGLVLNYQGFDLLLGGGMHAPQEEKLARSGVLEDVDVYQANHHGSHTSTSQALVICGDRAPDSGERELRGHHAAQHRARTRASRRVDPEAAAPLPRA